MIVNIADDTRLELGVGYEDYDDAGNALGFGGGIYWDPVSQLTLGIGATYVEFNDVHEFSVADDRPPALPIVPMVTLTDVDDADSLQIFFGTWFRFP